MPLQIVRELNEIQRPDCDIETLAVGNERLFSSAERGKIKIWNTENLEFISELNADQGGVYSLLIKDNYLYAGTAGNQIIVWDLIKETIVHQLIGHDDSVRVLRYVDPYIYTGDSAGNVCVWQNDQLVGLHKTCEEIWDMIVTDSRLYAIRDRDMVVYKFADNSYRDLMTLTTIEGRGPLCRFNGKICLLTRDGLRIQVLDDRDICLPLITKLEGQERIINALACSPDGNRLYAGGWDSTLRSWDMSTFAHLSDVDLGQPVNCICVNPFNGDIFVGGNSGLVAKLNDG